MKNEMFITKEISDSIVQICTDIYEFRKICDQDHPKSAKNIFNCNENVKQGVKWFINSESSKEMQMNIADYLKVVETTLQLYEALSDFSIADKDKLILHLSHLQTHLTALKNQITFN